MKFAFVVLVDIPDPVHQPDPYEPAMLAVSQRELKKYLRDYIKDAVTSWSGQYWVGHVMRQDSVKITVRHMMREPRNGK